MTQGDGARSEAGLRHAAMRAVNRLQNAPRPRPIGSQRMQIILNGEPRSTADGLTVATFAR